MIQLALRHLLSRKVQSSLILFGIVMGTTAYVAISGIMLGFQTFIIDQLVNNDSHIRISAREEAISPKSMEGVFFKEHETVQWFIPPSGRRDNAALEHPLGWFEILDGDSRVEAYSAQLVVNALARRGPVNQTVRIIGVDPEKQKRVTTIEQFVISGKFSDIGRTGNRILVGEGLLNRMGARVSETLLLSTGTSAPIPFKIIGSFKLGIKNLDDSTIYAAIADVQSLNQTPSQISDIAIRLINVEWAAAMATQWAALTRDKVLSWDQSNTGFLSVFKTQDIVRNSMTIAILVVASFGIYNILSILVNQKRKEIAILRSIGYESKDILFLFFVQGMILGALGGIIGLGLGYLICRILQTIPLDTDRPLGPSNSMLISYDLMIYFKGFLLSFLSSTFSGLLPARVAGKMTPIDIIRSES